MCVKGSLGYMTAGADPGKEVGLEFVFRPAVIT